MVEKNTVIIDKIPLEKCIDNFQKYILGNENNTSPKPYIYNNKEDLLTYGIKGNLSSIFLRPMIYKIFLNHLPIDKNLQQWISITFNNRVSYLQLKSKYFSSQAKCKNVIKNTFNRSIINSKNNNKNYNNETDEEKDEEIKNIIELDLSRTFQDISLFKDSKIIKMLFNVLYIYSKEHLSTVSYKQGMNEIISILFLSLYPYYFPCKKNISKNDLVNAINLYNKRLKIVLHKNNQNNQTNNSNINNKNIKKYNPQPINNKTGLEILFNFFHDEKFLEVDLYYLFSDLMDKGFNIFFKDDSFQKRCDNIINNKLKIIEYDLYNHCINNKVAYQIFLGKWIRTFFDQLININNCISILDIIISQDFLKNNMNNEINIIKKNDINEFEYIDCICLSMIKKYKAELLKKNGDEFLIFCLCYPGIQNFSEVIQSANYINLTIKNRNIDIIKINDNTDKNLSLKITPKKRVYYGKSLKSHLTIKTNSLYNTDNNPKLFKTKKLIKTNTIITNIDKKTYNNNNISSIISPSNNVLHSDKKNKSSNLLEVKKNTLNNKQNSNNKEDEKNKNKGIGSSFLHLFDDFKFNDLIDAYYF